MVLYTCPEDTGTLRTRRTKEMEKISIIKKLKNDYCEHRRLYDHKIAKNTQVAKIDYIIHLFADLTNREYIKSLKILENYYFNYLGEQKNGK